MNQYQSMSHLSLKELVRECSNGTSSYAKILSEFEKESRKNIHEVFRYQKFQEDFTDSLTCYSDGEHIVGYIGFSYQEFFKKLSHFLHLSSTDTSFQERLEDLKNIRVKEQLMEEFPVIYQDYANGFTFLKEMETSSKNKEDYETKRHYYYACGLRKGFQHFIETQGKVYDRFVNRKEEYDQLIHSHSLNALVRKHLDLDKVAMYVIHTYLQICENTEDQEVLLRFLPLIQKYIETAFYQKEGSIRIHHVQVDYESILSRYEKVCQKRKKDEKILSWELVPEGKEYPENLKKPFRKRKLEMSEEEKERLRLMGIEKRKFYESTPYLARVMGVLEQEGYIGYIYSNGEVILDRNFQEENISSASGNAIYHIKAVDFELLSQCDKTTLKNHPKVGRMIHSKYWKSKVRSLTLKEGSEEDQEEAKKLIRRLENQKKNY